MNFGMLGFSTSNCAVLTPTTHRLRTKTTIGIRDSVALSPAATLPVVVWAHVSNRAGAMPSGPWSTKAPALSSYAGRHVRRAGGGAVGVLDRIDQSPLPQFKRR